MLGTTLSILNRLDYFSLYFIDTVTTQLFDGIFEVYLSVDWFFLYDESTVVFWWFVNRPPTQLCEPGSKWIQEFRSDSSIQMSFKNSDGIQEFIN